MVSITESSLRINVWLGRGARHLVNKRICRFFSVLREQKRLSIKRRSQFHRAIYANFRVEEDIHSCTSSAIRMVMCEIAKRMNAVRVKVHLIRFFVVRRFVLSVPRHCVARENL